MHDLPKLFYCDKLVQFERKKSKKGEFAFEEDLMQLLQLQKKKKRQKPSGSLLRLQVKTEKNM